MTVFGAGYFGGAHFGGKTLTAPKPSTMRGKVAT
jgi:hypothetical protein